MPKRPLAEAEGALYVKLPANAVEKLHRAAEMLGIKKKDLVANLVKAMPLPKPLEVSGPGPTLGSYSFQPHDPPEVLDVRTVAELLQLEQSVVLDLAEAGKMPGRKLGTEWRFSRTAIIAWLAG